MTSVIAPELESQMAGRKMVFPDFHHLFAPIGTDIFFADCWQQRSVNFSLTRNAFVQIIREVGPLDIAHFARVAREGVRAWIANEYIEHSVLPVDAENARKLFDIGATLYFINIPLERLTNAVADFLGAPRQKIVASMFLTPPSGGASPHFDKNENFTIQLTGRKQWVVDVIPMAAAPLDGYVLGQPVPSSLRNLLGNTGGQLKQTIDIRAGDMLYVPRGAVHQTFSDEMSWSLNLSYVPFSWVDIIRVGLCRRLEQSARWRGSVAGMGDKCDMAAHQANIFRDLIVKLRDMLNDPAEVDRICQDLFDKPGT